MGKTDHVTKEITRKPEVFAELFNEFVFHEKILNPETMRECNTSELLDINGVTRELLRDVINKCTTYTDGKTICIVLGLENQSDVNYVMPLRNMMYDSINYSRQAEQRAKEVRSQKGISSSEWLSGFRKEDKLNPVVTAAVYWGMEKWDGPRSLHDMLEPEAVKKFGKYINDYPMHLISIPEMTKEEIDVLKTDLHELFEFIQASVDSKKLKELMKDERYNSLSRDVADALSVLTGVKFDSRHIDEKGNVQMCKAIDDMQAEARAEAEKAKKQLKKEKKKAAETKEQLKEEKAKRAEEKKKAAETKALLKEEKKKRKEESNKRKEEKEKAKQAEERNILTAYETLKEANPQYSGEEVIALIARIFHKSTSSIAALVI